MGYRTVIYPYMARFEISGRIPQNIYEETKIGSLLAIKTYHFWKEVTLRTDRFSHIGAVLNNLPPLPVDKNGGNTTIIFNENDKVSRRDVCLDAEEANHWTFKMGMQSSRSGLLFSDMGNTLCLEKGLPLLYITVDTTSGGCFYWKSDQELENWAVNLPSRMSMCKE